MQSTLETHHKLKLSDWTSLKMGGLVENAHVIRDGGGQLSLILGSLGSQLEGSLILGDGSNVVISDEGVEGCVIRLESTKNPTVIGDLVIADGGVDWDQFVEFTVVNGLSGVELLSGIPGRVGAAPIQNIGAYGQEVSEVIEWVELVWLDTLETEVLSADECGFGYRSSVFKDGFGRSFVVSRVGFRLRRTDVVDLSYRDLVERLGGRASSMSGREAVLDIRRLKGMTKDHGYGYSSAGSFFVNPVLSKRQWEQFRNQMGEGVPIWEQPNGDRKLAAAWLIEHAGFKRGLRRGHVGISPRHALSLVNFGGGKTTDLLTLAAEIQRGVYETFGIWLVAEPSLIGKGIERFRHLKSDGPT